MSDFPRGQVFGTWDAPMTDDDIPIETPVGATCIWCQTTVQDGDNGRIAPAGHIEHRECSLRGVLGGIGHQIDHDYWCTQRGDPDAGLGYRASALMVWNWHQITGGTMDSSTQRDMWRRALLLVAEGKN